MWSEEIIDRKLILTHRRENTTLSTIDYIVPAQQNRGETLLFRTHACEQGRIILQLGTSSADGAVAAALHVARDVAGIDVNMGCPKKFSVDNGMGAALLADQDRACAIVSALKAALSIPVTAKVRLLSTREASIALLQRLQAAGVDAVTVHLRQAGDKETSSARGWEELAALTQAVPTLPVLVNGDMYNLHRVQEMVQKAGCAGAILARPILLNASILRQEGHLPQRQVLTAFVRKCLKWDLIYQLAKYTLMEMMVLRRHPPDVLKALQDEPGGMPEHGRQSELWDSVQASKSLLDICKAFGMEKEYYAHYEGNSEGALPGAPSSVGESKSNTKRLREPSTLGSVHRLDDGHGFHSSKKLAIDLSKAAVNGSTVEFRIAGKNDVKQIVAITNDAYVADEFFKLPQYFLRFTEQNVIDMIAGDGVFLVACAPDNGPIVASLYIVRTIHQKEDSIHAHGAFSAVAVGTQYDRRGIGSALVSAAEKFVIEGGLNYETSMNIKRTADIEMGVINVRDDLFKWYGKFGYIRGENLPNGPELQLICKPDMDIFCVLMNKTLS